MAVYHLTAQVIGRSGGRSCVAAAAYRAAERIKCERDGKTHDYQAKRGVEHKAILAPSNAPSWVHNRATLWNEVEKAEKRKDAQLAREVRVAIPKELSPEQQVALVQDYCQSQFVDKGMVADVCIHREDRGNPHAHIMLTMRSIDENGFGLKDVSWNRKDALLAWRAEWALGANLVLERAGHQVCIDHRSYEDQGIRLKPTVHLGVKPEGLERDGREVIKERVEEYYRIVFENGEAIRRDPSIALEALTRQRAVFTDRDVARWLATYTTDARQFRACLLKVVGSDELVPLGKNFSGKQLYTTKEMLEVERRTLDVAQEMAGSSKHRIAGEALAPVLNSTTMSEQQQVAFRHVVCGQDLAVVQGFAGAGKSYMLGAAREAWEAQGWRVFGAVLAGKAAEGLEASAGIPSRSLASWEYAWNQGKDALGPKDVLVIDEAGMVGTRQMDRVLQQARDAHAKVVLVGDTGQLQAIEAGAPLRLIGNRVGECFLTEIRRQDFAWQRDAVELLGKGRPGEALRAFDERGCVHEHATKDAACAELLERWNEGRKTEPDKSQIILAYKRADVRMLNEQARELRRADRELGLDQRVETNDGPRDFAEQDRVCFLKNDRQLGVMNGTLGTVEGLQLSRMCVRLDDGQRVVFNTDEYKHIDHGYAATVHKAQGVTVDRAHVLASELFDRHTTYVALSRQRERVDLHWTFQNFHSRQKFEQCLSRDRPKEVALEFEEARQRNVELQERIEERRKEREELARGDELAAERDRQKQHDEEHKQEERRAREAEVLSKERDRELERRSEHDKRPKEQKKEVEQRKERRPDEDKTLVDRPRSRGDERDELTVKERRAALDREEQREAAREREKSRSVQAEKPKQEQGLEHEREHAEQSAKRGAEKERSEEREQQQEEKIQKREVSLSGKSFERSSRREKRARDEERRETEKSQERRGERSVSEEFSQRQVKSLSQERSVEREKEVSRRQEPSKEQSRETEQHAQERSATKDREEERVSARRHEEQSQARSESQTREQGSEHERHEKREQQQEAALEKSRSEAGERHQDKTRKSDITLRDEVTERDQRSVGRENQTKHEHSHEQERSRKPDSEPTLDEQQRERAGKYASPLHEPEPEPKKPLDREKPQERREEERSVERAQESHVAPKQKRQANQEHVQQRNAEAERKEKARRLAQEAKQQRDAEREQKPHDREASREQAKEVGKQAEKARDGDEALRDKAAQRREDHLERQQLEQRAEQGRAVRRDAEPKPVERGLGPERGLDREDKPKERTPAERPRELQRAIERPPDVDVALGGRGKKEARKRRDKPKQEHQVEQERPRRRDVEPERDRRQQKPTRDAQEERRAEHRRKVQDVERARESHEAARQERLAERQQGRREAAPDRDEQHRQERDARAEDRRQREPDRKERRENDLRVERLREKYEQMTPEEIRDHKRDLERIARQQTRTPRDMLMAQREVAREMAERRSTQDLVEANARMMKRIEKSHPVRTRLGKLGIGEDKGHYENLEQQKAKLKEHEERLEKMLKDPKRQERAERDAKQHNERIQDAKYELEHGKPFFDKAEKALELMRERRALELAKEHKLDRGWER